MSNESFIPPDLTYPLLWFIDASLEKLLLAVHNIQEVVITNQDKETLRKLNPERLIYISNHPSTKEPPITFLVGNKMCTRFHYMASREVFSWNNGFVGEFIKRIGAYSVIAGTGDRESLKATRSILSEPAGKLVLFPEGEPTGGENDNLLPFQPGVSQLAFWGYEDALKKDPKADIVILPAFVKYRYVGNKKDIQRDVDKSLEILEAKFSISKKGKDITHRLLSIGKRLLERGEKEFGIAPDESKTYDFRVGRLRHFILDLVAERANIKNYNKEDHAIDKLRKLLSTFEMVFIGHPDPKGELPSRETSEWGRALCQRVYDFISIQTNYLVSFPSAERIYEWIYRFEAELLKSYKPRPSKAYVHISEPFRISEFYSGYKKDKKGTVESLTTRLRNEVQKMLNQEMKLSSRLFDEEHRF